MNKKSMRTKTKYTSIYFNENTKKFDVKYNYKEYDLASGRNVYKSKWVYGIDTITQARDTLASLRTTDKPQKKPTDITLSGAYELWKIKATGQNFSPVTLDNMADRMKTIYRFLPADTKLKDIDENAYYKFCADIRVYGYSEETLSSVNASFRKLINLAYRRKLISENILSYAENMRTGKKEDYRVIEKSEFDEIDKYFKLKEQESQGNRGTNNYQRYRLLFNILYFCGLRIGEALALTYNDFEEYKLIKKDSDKPDDLMRIKVTKSYVSNKKLIKEPKNLKKRAIPLVPSAERLFRSILKEHIREGGSLDERIFLWTDVSCGYTLKRACKAMNIADCSCHDFRHTFISNLIRKGVPFPVVEKVSGDTQATILKRYSHVFEADELMVLSALQDL